MNDKVLSGTREWLTIPFDIGPQEDTELQHWNIQIINLNFKSLVVITFNHTTKYQPILVPKKQRARGVAPGGPDRYTDTRTHGHSETP